MKDNYIYKYYENEEIFILKSKYDVLNSLIDHHLDNLDIIYNKFLEENKIDKKTKN